MMRLEFVDFTFPEEGPFVTVRNGLKYTALLVVGEQIDLVEKVPGCAQTNPRTLRAVVRGIVTAKLGSIPPHVLDFEHSPSARTAEGLLKGMRECYGDGITKDSPVTVISLELVQPLVVLEVTLRQAQQALIALADAAGCVDRHSYYEVARAALGHSFGEFEPEVMALAPDELRGALFRGVEAYAKLSA